MVNFYAAISKYLNCNSCSLKPEIHCQDSQQRTECYHRRASAAVGATGDAVVQRRLVDDLSTRCCQLVYRRF